MTNACIFLPAMACSGVDAQLHVSWVISGACFKGSLADALAVMPARWRLVLPVESVTVCAVSLPTQKARWLKQALPFAVEELLAEEVESLHLCLGAVLPDGRHRVYAVQRQWLAECLALCPVTPCEIVCDADLLPMQGTQLCWLGGRWLLAGEMPARLSFEASQWPLLVGECASPYICHSPQQEKLEPVDEVFELAEPEVWLAAQAASVNLAQAQFSPSSERQGWRAWRPVAAAVVLGLALQWAFNLGQGWYFAQQAEQYRAANMELYRSLFPEDTRIVNLRAQFDQHLSQGQGPESGLLQVLAAVAEPLTADTRVHVQQMSFDHGRDELLLQVKAQGFADLDLLRERLQQAGAKVALGAASREGAAVNAQVVIGG